jgi:hypothetical protein
MFDAKTVILTVLEIINYQKDKNQFANEFVDLCCRKALVAAIATLPESRRKRLEKNINGQKDIDKAITEILKFISKDLYQKKLILISEETLTKYINTIMPAISPEQEKELRKYLNDLGNIKI